MKINYDFRDIEAFRTLSDGEIKTMIEKYILNDTRVNELLSRGGIPAPSYVPMEYEKITEFTEVNTLHIVGFIKSVELVSDTVVSVNLKQTRQNVIIKAIKPRMLYSNYSQRIFFISFDAVAV